MGGLTHTVSRFLIKVRRSGYSKILLSRGMYIEQRYHIYLSYVPISKDVRPSMYMQTLLSIPYLQEVLHKPLGNLLRRILLNIEVPIAVHVSPILLEIPPSAE